MLHQSSWSSLCSGKCQFGATFQILIELRENCMTRDSLLAPFIDTSSSIFVVFCVRLLLPDNMTYVGHITLFQSPPASPPPNDIWQTSATIPPSPPLSLSFVICVQCVCHMCVYRVKQMLPFHCSHVFSQVNLLTEICPCFWVKKVCRVFGCKLKLFPSQFDNFTRSHLALNWESFLGLLCWKLKYCNFSKAPRWKYEVTRRDIVFWDFKWTIGNLKFKCVFINKCSGLGFNFCKLSLIQNICVIWKVLTGGNKVVN